MLHGRDTECFAFSSAGLDGFAVCYSGRSLAEQSRRDERHLRRINWIFSIQDELVAGRPAAALMTDHPP